ncbi:hypothetical protein [Pontibacter litorisediminis]|uniref:hypothetical protein n=1 Tax=Pontibacter litorisediminis TaxID=1846260 RepID=UPI0023EE0F52|nr:hypothetical protein [Pontibacter litorisediminis]
MKKIEYSKEAVDTLRLLIGKTAERVIYNFMYYILDFGDYHILFPMELETGLSETGEQEIKYTFPVLYHESVKLERSDIVVADSFKIESIQILQTLLYWKKVEKENVNIRVGDEAAAKVVADLIAVSFETEEELMIKPSTAEDFPLEPKYKNLVDVGIRIRNKNNSLIIAPIDNCFGFMEHFDGFFWNEENIEARLSESYDFIVVDKKN